MLQSVTFKAGETTQELRLTTGALMRFEEDNEGQAFDVLLDKLIQGKGGMRLLVSALPESYQTAETSPGEYLVEGQIDPQVLATVTAWCARLDVLATDMRVEQRSLEDVFLDLTGRELRS